MKKFVSAVGLSVVMASVAITANAMDLNNKTDKLSYTIGADMGQNFKRQSIDINPKAVSQGLADVLAGGDLKMSKDQMRQTLQDFQKELIAKRLAQYKKEADKNQKAGEQFLSENKAKPGVMSTSSGLQYKVLQAGTGNKPTKTDTVKVEYTGKLLNGTVFDKSDKPAMLQLDRVIPGWTEALQMMKEGAKWEVYIPAKLAYGPRGFGREIGPNQTLIFNIHLLSIEKDNKSSQS